MSKPDPHKLHKRNVNKLLLFYVSTILLRGYGRWTSSPSKEATCTVVT